MLKNTSTITAFIIGTILLLFVSAAWGAKRGDDSRPAASEKVKVEKPATVMNPVTESEAPTQEVTPDTKPIEPQPTDGPRAGEEVNWQVVASGGGMVDIGPNLRLGGTLGQVAVGTTTIGTMQLNSGFWQNWEEPTSCCVVRGDVDNSGDGPDISDIVYLVDWMFRGGPAAPCEEQADVDNSGGDPDISDLVYMVDYMFRGGPLPPPCD